MPNAGVTQSRTYVTSWADHVTHKVSSGHDFGTTTIHPKPRAALQSNPPIKAQMQSHVANRLELLCNFEHFGPMSVQENWVCTLFF